jgi:hypothetical protein
MFNNKKYSSAIFEYPCEDMGCSETAVPVLVDVQSHVIISTKDFIGPSSGTGTTITSYFTTAHFLPIRQPTSPQAL